jgi:hypothetical protein
MPGGWHGSCSTHALDCAVGDAFDPARVHVCCRGLHADLWLVTIPCLPTPLCRRALVEEVRARFEVTAESADCTSVRAKLSQVRPAGLGAGGLGWLGHGTPAKSAVAAR